MDFKIDELLDVVKNGKIEKILKIVEKEKIRKQKEKFSKRYRIKRFLHCMKKENPFVVIKRYHDNRVKIKKLQKFETKRPVDNPEYKPVYDKKIVIYTCISGDYDMLNEPFYYNQNVEYVIFTNQKFRSENWKIKKIPKKILNLNDDTLINRYVKMHPHEMFKKSDYDYAIYIDGNIRTLTDLSGFVRCVNKSGLAMFRHHSRDCIFIEEKACSLQHLGDKKNIRRQLERYEKEGFPKDFGMLEATIIVSDLKSKKALDLLSNWWEEFYKTESMRDQLSLPYVLWKNNKKIDYIGYLGNNLRWCPKFERIQHKK